MNAPIRTWHWNCGVEGCCGPRSHGAGFPSEGAAAKAERHHIASAHPRLAQRLGVGQ